MVVTSIVGFGLALGAIVALGRSDRCVVRAHPALTYEQLIDVKHRFEAHQGDPQAPIALSGRELAMLLEDEADVPLFVELRDGRLRGRVAVPSVLGGCWPVEFDGKLAVREGQARFQARSLFVGELSLGSVVGRWTLPLGPEQMPSRRAENLLRQTRSASVVDSRLVVQLLDPTGFRWQ